MPEEVVENEGNKKQNKNRRRNLMLAGILLGVMLIEGAGVFILVKRFGPSPAAAKGQITSGIDGASGEELPERVELEVAQLRAPNEKLGLVLYEMNVCAVVNKPDVETCERLLEEKKWKIQDRLCGVIREADPKDLQDNLDVVRRKFKTELAEVLGKKDMIKEILIPRIVPFSAN
jgi:hypothetical protein